MSTKASTNRLSELYTASLSSIEYGDLPNEVQTDLQTTLDSSNLRKEILEEAAQFRRGNIKSFTVRPGSRLGGLHVPLYWNERTGVSTFVCTIFFHPGSNGYQIVRPAAGTVASSSLRGIDEESD
jgi:hypothetical protein